MPIMPIIKKISTFIICFIAFNTFFINASHANISQKDDVPFSHSLTWAKDGNTQILVLQLTAHGENYTYAPNQKDLYPTTITLKFDATKVKTQNINIFKNIPLYFPQGRHKADPINPSKYVNLYENTTYIFITLDEEQTRSLPQNTHIALSFLACSTKRCMPMQIDILVPSTANMPLAKNLIWYKDFDTLKKNNDLNIRETLTIKNTPNIATNTTENNDDLATFDILNLQQSLPHPYNFTPKILDGTFEVSFLAKALLFGLLAGFILNFMPCVLPVIALKISSFLQSSQDEHIRKKQFREHNIFFALGIITWFMALGLLLGLAGMSWGQLFQEPKLILGILVFIFTLGLSLFGFFNLPFFSIHTHNDQKNTKPKLQAFGAGLMATLLATPCSGPLLGAVLGYSLTQNIFVLLTIFFAMGIGMALPYIFFAINPSLIRFMPKAGEWMHTMEHLLGFALMASVIYFISILPSAWQFKSLILLFIVAIAAYAWGKWGSINATGLKKLIVATLCIITISGASYQLFKVSDETILWEDFTPSTFSNALGKELLLLKFTADWCPTCKILEHTVFTEKNMQTIENDFNIRFITVDITQHDNQKQELLRSLDSVSIPLLAVFPKGRNHQYPIIIRDIYTYTQLLKAIETAEKDSN